MSDDIPQLCPTELEENRLLIIRCSAEARCRQFSNKFTAQERRHSPALNAQPCLAKAPPVRWKMTSSLNAHARD